MTGNGLKLIFFVKKTSKKEKIALNIKIILTKNATLWQQSLSCKDISNCSTVSTQLQHSVFFRFGEITDLGKKRTLMLVRLILCAYTFYKLF